MSDEGDRAGADGSGATGVVVYRCMSQAWIPGCGRMRRVTGRIWDI